MAPKEMEQYLTTFLSIMRDADRRYAQAVDEENLPNNEIQDLLHVAEFAPSLLEGKDIISVLHRCREHRRLAKKELEVTQLVKAWTDENKTALNKLEQTLGEIRKILKRQPLDSYRFKSNILDKKDEWLTPDNPPPLL